MANPLDDLNDWLDESIPDEVLDSPGWEPRLLPDLRNLKDLEYGYEDMIEDSEYGQ